MGNIEDPAVVAAEAAREYQACYGDALLSAVLYGSAAGADFDPGRSDVNLLLVLRRVSLEELARSAAVQKRWLKRRVTRPLFLDPPYVERSLDAFPVEFLNLKLQHRVLLGADLLSPLTIRREHLRLQIERELKGKRLHLFQAWLEARESSRRLRELAGLSLRDFAALFRALLYLREMQVPSTRAGLFAAVETTCGLEGEPFSALLRALQDKDHRALTAAFGPYSQAVTRLAEIVDATQTSG
jgi:predicted nucleotidyltransferase